MNLGRPGHLGLGKNLKRLGLGRAHVHLEHLELDRVHVRLEHLGLEGGRGRLGAR